MQQVSARAVVDELQVQRCWAKLRKCTVRIMCVAAVVAMSHGSLQFVQHTQQRSNAQTPGVPLYGRPQVTRTPPFSEPSRFIPQPELAARFCGQAVAVMLAIGIVATSSSPGIAGGILANAKQGESIFGTSGRFAMLPAVGESTTKEAVESTTKAVAKKESSGEKNRFMYEGTDLAGVYDEGVEEDLEYKEYCQGGESC